MEYKELIIKIPENYDLSKIQNGSIASKMILNAVANGIPLPKGHGGLIDVNEIIGKIHGVKSIQAVLGATVIIPADTESEGEE